MGGELPFADDPSERQVSGGESREAKDSNGSFCDMGRAGKRSFGRRPGWVIVEIR